ncbi:MAG TPA: F-box protein [Rhabdochlamydiaceae bacterium]|nr:F-box protein [Rhabdochlamydiaceae bacterium]
MGINSLSARMEFIKKDLKILEKQINAASFPDQAIPTALNILEQYSLEMKDLKLKLKAQKEQDPDDLQSLKNVKAIWKRVHSWCVSVVLQPNPPQELMSIDQCGLGDLSCLPNEALKNILSFVTVEDLCRVARCNRFLKEFCKKNDIFWEPHASILSQKMLDYHMEQGSTVKLVVTSDCWQVIRYNGEPTLIYIDEDGVIKFWDINKENRLDKVINTGFHVTNLRVENNLLFAAGSQGDTQIWDLNTMKCQRTFNSMYNRISTLQVEGDRLFFGSWIYGTFWVLDLKSEGSQPRLLDNHSIYCFQVVGDLLYSGYSVNGDIGILDLNTMECKGTLIGHRWSTHCLQVIGNFLISGSSDNTIKVWDLKAKECLATLEGHTDTIDCMQVEGHLLFSGSRDKTIKIWSLKTMQCLHTLTNNAPVNCLQVIDNRLFAGSWDDQKVKVWDFGTSLAALDRIIFEFKTDPASAVRHFKSLPKYQRNAIYKELCQICSLPEKLSDSDCFVKDAFTDEQRIEAIRRYLSTKSNIVASFFAP